MFGSVSVVIETYNVLYGKQRHKMDLGFEIEKSCIISHASGMALGMRSSVGWWANLEQTDNTQQLLDGLPWAFWGRHSWPQMRNHNDFAKPPSFSLAGSFSAAWQFFSLFWWNTSTSTKHIAKKEKKYTDVVTLATVVFPHSQSSPFVTTFTLLLF